MKVFTKVLSLLCLVMVLVAAWWIVSPGVLVEQPIGLAPEGVTLI